MVRNFGLTRLHSTFLFAGKNDSKDLFDILESNKLNTHFKELMVASQWKEFLNETTGINSQTAGASRVRVIL
ncbi:hypothetical protein C5167_002963, partial [Papaver somniferum]